MKLTVKEVIKKYYEQNEEYNSKYSLNEFTQMIEYFFLQVKEGLKAPDLPSIYFRGLGFIKIRRTEILREIKQNLKKYLEGKINQMHYTRKVEDLVDVVEKNWEEVQTTEFKSHYINEEEHNKRFNDIRNQQIP